ncbi:hypothetical protein ACDQ55_01850 [Chitinophaga sp. 30R24]|uniref:hypothetical protein n=1 Tax=Chitinophaga sp. 30R24 TaxID=3248838 RepID=UPI003B8ECE6F
MQKRILLFLYTVVLFFSACKKGDLPEEYYFGKVQVSGKGFQDSPDLDIFFSGKKIGTLNTSKASEPFLNITVPASNTPAKLSAYIANTTTLVADSMITVDKNSNKNFRLIYSESLGLKGFLTTTTVAPDSTKLQFLYNVNKSFNPYPEVDLYIYTGKGRPLTLTEVTVVKGLKRGVLDSRSIMLPCLDENGAGFAYYFKLKDVKTGEFIVLPTNFQMGAYLLINTNDTETYGAYSVININDAEGDTADDNYIEALQIVL